MKAVLLVLAFATALLAGCSDGGGAGPAETSGAPALESGKGAITGLLIDDAFRPLRLTDAPEGPYDFTGFLLLQPAGLTAQSDAEGVFSFTDLEPGSYTLRANVAEHEAAPLVVDVKEGEYTEANLVARRVANEAGQIMTNEYSVFVPCAANFIVNGVTANCLLDLSGDSYRSGFTSNLTAIQNITWMVTEFKFNQVGSWTGQIREDDGSTAGGERYAVADVDDTDYIRIQNQFGVVNTEANGQDNNVPWNNTKPFATLIFLNGEFSQEAGDASDQVSFGTTS